MLLLTLMIPLLINEEPPVRDTERLLKLLSDGRRTALRSKPPYAPPQELLVDLCLTATRIGGADAVRSIEQAADDFQRARLPPTADVHMGKLPGLVAAYDARARDRLLIHADNEARAALKVPELWKAKPLPPDVIPWEDPQKSLDRQRDMLGLRIRLWEAVRRQRTDPSAALRATERILTDGKAKGYYGDEIAITFEEVLLEEIAQLNVDLFLQVAKVSDRKTRLARVAGQFAYQRSFNFPDDPFAKRLLAFVTENGQKPPELPARKSQKGKFRPLTADERKERGLLRNRNPQEVRILENPADTSWLAGENRRMLHEQAACTAYSDTGDTKVALQILANLTNDDEREVGIWRVAEMAARAGDADKAIGLLEKIRNPSRAVRAVCAVAEALHASRD